MSSATNSPAPIGASESQGTDFGSGLLKSFFFGNIIATVSCLHGLRLRGGPDAVGRAATTAVVEAIIGVILFDALYTGLVYFVF